MKNLQITIQQVDNGYILSFNDRGETEVIEITTNFGYEKEEEEDQRAMTKLLERIAIFFGITYDGFSEKNLNIQWNLKGDEV